MKKNLLLLVLPFFMFTVAFTQSSTDPSFKRFGFRSGANYSHINFAKGVPPPVVPIDTKWVAGINIGFFMVVPITDKLFFQSEYAFAQMGGEEKTSGTVYKMNYLSLPLFIKYQLQEKFSVMAGPQFDLLVKAKETTGGSTTDITHDTEERSIGITGGIEYRITNAVSVCARYMHGFNHIGLGQRSNIQEFKYEMMQLTAAIHF